MKASELRIGNYFRKPDWPERADWHNEDATEDEKIHVTDLYGEVQDIHFEGRVGFSWDIPYMCNVIDTVQLSALEPIPLTEEWLIKLGFSTNYKETIGGKEYDIYHIQFGDEDERITWNSCEKIIFISASDDPYYGNKLKHIQYVHQLQNLYFALTRKELINK